MKQNVIIAILSILLVFVGVSYIREHVNNTLKNVDDKQKIKNSQTAITKDDAGRTHGDKQVVEGTRLEIEFLYKGKIDSLSKSLKISNDKIKSFATVKAKSDISGSIVYDYPPNEKQVPFKFNLGTTEVTKDSNDVLHVHWEDSLAMGWYRTRKWFLGSWTNHFNAYSLDTNVHVSNIDAATIIYDEPSEFGIGPIIGVTYKDKKIQPIYGIALSWQIKRFKKRNK